MKQVQKIFDKKRRVREMGHLTRPPRLEGVMKEGKMRSVKKKRKPTIT
ncbi:hypothetical protein L0Y40_02455 [Candidatus Wolfebacteria bacterium]|nr:hypothetical protein [Candidatus Wolfebacteria bacterium]